MADISLSQEAIDILCNDAKHTWDDGYTSPVLYAWLGIIDDEARLRQQIVQTVEDMFVSIGWSLRERGLTDYVLASKDGFVSELQSEFQRRFPVYREKLLQFMQIICTDLKQSMRMGYKIHGEWGIIALNNLEEISFQRS